MEDNWEDCAEEEEFDGEALYEEEIDFLVTLSRFRVQEAQIKELKQQVNQLAASVAELAASVAELAAAVAELLKRN